MFRLSVRIEEYIGGDTIPLESIEDEDEAAVYHVPFVEWEIVDVIGDEIVVCDAKGLEHGLLPEATAAFDGGESVDDAKCKDTFDGSGYDA